MEDLVKGLINVAFGQGEDDDRNSEERSRSTWAQVVSGEPDDRDGSSSSTDRQNRQEDERNEGRGSGESRSRMRPQMAGHQEYDRDDDSRQRHDNSQQANWNRKQGKEADDGWETVGRKPAKQHYKTHNDQWKNYKRPLDEQDYSSEVKYGVGIEPSEEELNDLPKALNKLWELDSNRLVAGKDYEVDFGEGKKVYQKGDMAQGCLFTWLSEDIFRKPTFARFCSLLDNYNPQEGFKESVTPEERQEQAAFIEEISRTAPIKYLHRYLSSKGIISENDQDFKRMMTSLWFDLYGRGGTSGSSSAFEHVFVGEIKQRGEQEVSGFHNWLQFYLEEAKGRVDYQGYILPRRHGQIPDSETQLVTVQFEWNGVLKSVSSTLIGVSPEFEIALYTLCFYLGSEENHVELGPYPVNIKCYRLGNKIGSAFPVAEC